jgi:asparagine synthase (glutamine-hydrolysing)
VSGLFGIVDVTGESDIRQFLDSARAALSHLPWHSGDSWVPPGLPLGMGRVGIGIFNRDSQPITSADGNVVLLMSGELYETPALQRQLEAAGYAPRDASHPELALCAFLAYGTDFAAKLNGAFFIAVYDAVQRRLLLTNDRYGLYPHYYHDESGKLVFGPEVKSVLRAPFVTKKLNVTAAAEYFRFQQLLGVKTFHEGILVFPYGSVGEFDLQNSSWGIHHYWDWDQIADRTHIQFEEASLELGHLLRRAVERRSDDGFRPGVFLTGGLDSRTLLGLMPPRNPPPISATFGVENSRDVYYAKQIADAVGSRHHWFDFPDGRWVLDNVELHLKLTEGFHSWIHMHGISMLPALREMMDFNLTGWDGGTVMGHNDHVNPIYNYPVDEAAVVVENFKNFNQSYTWPGLMEAEERMLYTPEFSKQATGRAFDSLREEFKPFWRFRKYQAAEFFYVVNHCWRSTINMVTTARSHIEVRFPFWDYDLIDYMHSIRPEVRGHQIIYRDIIMRETPKLAVIPYDKQEYLPTLKPMQHKLQALSVRARRRLGLFPERATLYADYENYLRHELRAWAEGILFDPRTEQRGIYNMPFVRTLMARHLSGHEEWTIGKIAPLITFEMMMRMNFD